MSVAGSSDGKKMSVGGSVKSGGRVTTLTPSLVSRVAQGIRYAVTGNTPNAWFGPEQPLPPVAQQAEGRVLDYQTGYNQQAKPRQETEPVISFRELRALGDACELVRMAVETRKDQIARLNWNIKPRDTGKQPANDGSVDPRLLAIETFFRFPDKEHDWGTWLRALIEDLLVIDAPTLFRRKDKSGAPYAFNVMDGTLIKRVIDEHGLTPMPPNPAYQQILHGMPAVDYTTERLLYLPRNVRSHRLFGYSPVEQVVMTVNIALRRSMSQLSYFTEGNIPEALISCPPDWRPEQIRQMQAFFDDMLRGNIAERSGAKFVPGGMNVQFTKDALLKDDFDEWLARIVCFAFSLAPTPFIKAARSGEAQKTAHAAAQEEGLAPLQQWVKNMMDRLLAEDFISPDLEFVWFDDTEADPLVLAQVNQIYVAGGIKTRNEVRGELGLDPIPDGDEITITAGNTVVRLSDALDPPDPAPQNANTPDQVQKPENEQTVKEKDLTKAEDDLDREDQESHEERLTILLAFALRRQGDLIAAKIGGTEHTLSGAAEELERAVDSGALDMSAAQTQVAAVLEQSATEAAHEALADLPSAPEADATEAVPPGPTPTAETGVATYSTDRSVATLINQDAVEFARQRSAELIGRKWIDGKLVDNPNAKWAITDTTRDGIRALVRQAEEKGQSVPQLAKAIRESALFSKERAARIAQWELGFSANNGNLIAWKRSGLVEGKQSILGSEHMICDECDANVKAGVIGLGDLFPSGHPCPPYHPQCPCSMVPVLNSARGP